MNTPFPRILTVSISALGITGGILIGYASGLFYMLDIGREITKEAITPAVSSGVFCLILAVVYTNQQNTKNETTSNIPVARHRCRVCFRHHSSSRRNHIL